MTKPHGDGPVNQFPVPVRGAQAFFVLLGCSAVHVDWKRTLLFPVRQPRSIFLQANSSTLRLNANRLEQFSFLILCPQREPSSDRDSHPEHLDSPVRTIAVLNCRTAQQLRGRGLYTNHHREVQQGEQPVQRLKPWGSVFGDLGADTPSNGLISMRFSRIR